MSAKWSLPRSVDCKDSGYSGDNCSWVEPTAAPSNPQVRRKEMEWNEEERERLETWRSAGRHWVGVGGLAK